MSRDGGGPRRWQVSAVRVLAFAGLLAMGLPVLWVISDVVVGALVGGFGGDPNGSAAGAAAWVVAVLLFVPLALLASRTSLEGVAVGRRTMRGWAEKNGWSSGSVSEVFEGRWHSPPFSTTRTQVRDLVSRTEWFGTVFSMTYVADDVPRHVVTTARPFDGPPVRLAPRTLLRAAAVAAGAMEVSTEWADFNARWSIQSADPRYALAFVHPRTMERLMEVDDPALEVLFEAGDVVVHRPGRTALGRVSPMAQLVVDLAELVPGYVLEQDSPPPRGATRRRLRHAEPVRREGCQP